MTFKSFDPQSKVSDMEKSIVAFWGEEKIFEKSVSDRSESELYTFYDGPPFATGLPHYGHIVASTIKDVIPRYWTMKGKRVERVWGWDCHGLPIENIVEKELGTKSKKDIEKLGVAKFNEICRSKVMEYAHEWERIIPRLGRWADMSNAYRTMDKDYMESVWWVFKTIYDKGLVYEDYRTMHVCPRCETTLSQSEVAEGYKDVKDLAVTAKFELTDEAGTYVLAWTTTPWTLPGNVALAVGESIKYSKIQCEEDFYICATSLVENVFGEREYKIIGDVTAKSLIGKSYIPLWDYYAGQKDVEKNKNGWKIYAADFITDESGTGIAHEAPAFGADDMALGKEKNLPWVQHVNLDGTMKDEVTDFATLNVKPIDDHQATDIAIIKNLAHGGKLFSKQKYEHSYPHCWRCDTPLLNYATSSWFVSVLKIKEKLLEDAKDITWSPPHIKQGRWGKWLEGARDWSISRQRFWASVIPLWRCSELCGAQEVFGDAAALEAKSGQKIDDLHKHIVDEVTFPCEKDGCSGTMTRIPDVLDTWFDSGSMPYAQMHYPFENKEKFDSNFPANFISEGVDQTRAWFYYLHVLSGGVMEKEAFQNVIVNGIVLAEDGKKMSKKLQNYPDPMEMVDKYGADALRLYLMSSPVVNADNLSFNEKDVAEISRGTLRMLRQSYSFFLMYAQVDGWKVGQGDWEKSTNILDTWMVSRLHTTVASMELNMDNYDLQSSARAFAPLIDDLSNWYIRRSRKRFWKSEDDSDKNNAYATLHYVLVEIAKLMAPFTPFLSEEIYKNLEEGDSVHLESYPDKSGKMVDQVVGEQMATVRSFITIGLEHRAKAGLKVRQPLASITLKEAKENLNKELESIILEELNVKEVLYDDRQKDIVVLNTDISPALKLEGQAREIIRFIQQGRKKAGFEIDDRITLGYAGCEDIFESHGDLIAHETLATKLHNALGKDSHYTQDVRIDDKNLTISLNKEV